MYPDGYPHNLGGYGWIWIIIADNYPFSSIYQKVLSAIPGWFRDHVWTSLVVNHDWGSIHALAGTNGGVSPPRSPMDHHFASMTVKL